MFYWTKWLSKLTTQHRARQSVKDITRKDEYLSMFIHAGAMLLMCLLFPFLATGVVNPILESMFGYASTVLSMSVLATMAIMLISVLIVPTIMAFVNPYGKTRTGTHLHEWR